MAKREKSDLTPAAPKRQRLMVSVWCLPDEKAAIEALAEGHQLSVSSYLRTLGLGFEPVSTFDAESMSQLAKVNADQGRLGGLFKHYLARDDQNPAVGKALVGLLQEIKSLQAKLDGLAGRLES